MAMSRQQKGGRARAARLGAKKRREIARMGAKARWSRPKKVLRDRRALEIICERHGIKALYAFGSILRDDFGPQSDVDLLYVPKRDDFSFSDYCRAVRAFEELFGRDVDLVSKVTMEQTKNPYRRKHILESAELVHEEA